MTKRPIDRWGQEGVDAACEFLKRWEGLRLEAYKAVPSERYWTCGYGHYGKDIKPGQVIDEITADLWLDADVKHVQTRLAKLIEVPVTLTQSTALISFAFNVGIGAFERSTMRRLLNAGKKATAAYEFRKWCNSGGVRLDGLVRRREAEMRLFREGM